MTTKCDNCETIFFTNPIVCLCNKKFCSYSCQEEWHDKLKTRAGTHDWVENVRRKSK